MAKMFYTMEEAQEKLQRTDDEIKQLVKEGLLREFRDGARIMFKVDEVDNLIASGLSSTGSGEIRLAPEDSTDQFGLAPSDTAEDLGLPDTGSSLGLTPDSPSASGSGPLDLSATDSAELISLAPGDSADQVNLDDTSQVEDKDDTVVTSHGVNVLDDSDDELELADPLAQTQIAPDLDDQVDLDSGSSGSGLLDLSREADDTSLGAELLEEIYPGSDDERAVETVVPGGLEMAAEMSTTTSEAHAPALGDYTVVVQAPDPTSGAFGAMMVVPLLALILLGSIAAAQVSGVYPNFVAALSGLVWPIIGAGAALALIIAGVGSMITGRSAAPGTTEAAQPKKAPKEKKKKEKKAKAK